MRGWHMMSPDGRYRVEKRGYSADTMPVEKILAELRGLENPEAASFSRKFFKTGRGEYGEGDLFRGIRVPILRKLARKYQNIPLAATERLLRSGFHEDRLLALLILVRIYSGGDAAMKNRIHKLYLRNTAFINSWDLVDVSAPHLVGDFLSGKGKELLYRLARSRNVWERRMAVMATFTYIRQGAFDETLGIARVLLPDPEDLVHKAVGWMLREVGKRDLRAEERFLHAHCTKMPRTMLRYAIEKFPARKRQRYLRGKVDPNN
jgi:3-methyladenine DNA glycosylase AlkD